MVCKYSSGIGKCSDRRIPNYNIPASSRNNDRPIRRPTNEHKGFVIHFQKGAGREMRVSGAEGEKGGTGVERAGEGGNA